jgi:hypothetical protein
MMDALRSRVLRIRFTPNPDRLAIDPRLLFALLCLEAGGLYAFRAVGTLQFDSFAFFDTGANLTAQYLIRQGYRPAVDFAYHYGLLPLLVGRVWFGVFGLSPFALVALIPVLDLIIVWGLVRFAANLKLQFGGVLLLVLSGPLVIPSGFLNLAHGLEPALLIHALADWAGGNRWRALATAAVCVFVKPSMAFFVGLLLLVFIVRRTARASGNRFLVIAGQVYPAAVAGAVVSVALAVEFGPLALAHSTFPSQGAAMYRAQSFGFFNGTGRAFWAPHGATWSYYLANPAGFWIVYTAVLSVTAALALRRAYARTPDPPGSDQTAEIIVGCAVLHLAFVLFLFGNQFSAQYYYYVLVFGVAAASRLGPAWNVLILCLALAFPLSKVGKAVVRMAPAGKNGSSGAAAGERPKMLAALPTGALFTFELWRSTSPSPVTANLWASAEERAEWERVLETIRNHRTAMLEYFGCADLLFPEFLPPVTLYLVAGNSNRREIARKVAQLRSSEMVVVPRWQLGLLNEQEAIGKLVRRDFSIRHDGAWFVVFARDQ